MALQTDIINFLTGRWGRIIALSLLGLMLLLAAVNIVMMLVAMVKGPTQQVVQPTEYRAPKAPPLSDITQWHLFGESPQEDIDAKDLPKSLVNATLVGVFLATPEKDAMVAIRLSDGKEKIYFAGERLPGDVLIFRILPDSVILKRRQRLEVLRLPQEKLQFEPAAKPLDFKQYQD